MSTRNVSAMPDARGAELEAGVALEALPGLAVGEHAVEVAVEDPADDLVGPERPGRPARPGSRPCRRGSRRTCRAARTSNDCASAARGRRRARPTSSRNGWTQTRCMPRPISSGVVAVGQGDAARTGRAPARRRPRRRAAARPGSGRTAGSSSGRRRPARRRRARCRSSSLRRPNGERGVALADAVERAAAALHLGRVVDDARAERARPASRPWSGCSGSSQLHRRLRPQQVAAVVHGDAHAGQSCCTARRATSARAHRRRRATRRGAATCRPPSASARSSVREPLVDRRRAPPVRRTGGSASP